MTQYSSKELSVGDLAPIPSAPMLETEITSQWERGENAPLVSIVVHSYQHANYVSHTLNGILMQKTRFPFEIIVHDDASTDGTRDVLQRYADQYPNLVRLILQDSNQFGKGRRPSEFTFPLARGKYIAMCEGDDYWLDENKLQIQADVMEADPSCAVCGHDAFIFKDGVVVSLSKLSARQKHDFDAIRLKKGIFALTLSLMFVNRIRDFPPEQLQSLNGDKFILSRLGAFGGYRYVGTVKPAAYRLHAGGIWSTFDQEKQNANRINTLYWLSRYYRNQGDHAMEAHFIGQITDLLCADLLRVESRDLRRMFRSLVRSFIRIRFPRLFHLIRRIRGRHG